MSIYPREYRKKWWMLSTYQKMIIDRIDKTTNSFYADYDFVQQFISPNFSVLRKHNSKVDMSFWVAGLAERVLKMYRDGWNCDDFLDMVLDSMVQNWYLAHYNYVWDIRDPDLKHADPSCKWLVTFDDLFKKGSGIAKAARANFTAYSLTKKLSETCFIGKWMFILWVWKWEVSFSPRAYNKKIRIWDFFEIVEFVSWDTSFINLVTWIETDISLKKKWPKDMMSLFLSMYQRWIDRLNIEEITRLWGNEDSYVTKVKKSIDIESNQLKTFDTLLTWINPDDVYKYGKNWLEIRVPIEVKEFGWG